MSRSAYVTPVKPWRGASYLSLTAKFRLIKEEECCWTTVMSRGNMSRSVFRLINWKT